MYFYNLKKFWRKSEIASFFHHPKYVSRYDAYMCWQIRFLVLPTSLPIFASIYVVSPYLSRSITSRWLSSFHPRVPRGTLAILRSSRDHDAFLVPFQFHETKGLDVQEKHFPSLARNSFRITFRKKGGEKGDIRGFWTEGKETRVSSSLQNLYSPVFSS